MMIDSAHHNDNNPSFTATRNVLMTARTVLFVGYEGVGLLDLTGPFTVFWSASWFLSRRGEPAYDRRVATVNGGPMRTADGITIMAEPLSAFDDVPIDTLVVPGALDLTGAMQNPELIEWIATHAPRARRICSVCTGTFVLAAAGLLDGKRVVTHWTSAGDLASQFPNLKVEPDAIFVRDDPVWSSAGVSAGIDLALALVQDDCGRQVAMSVARQLVVYMKRPGGQTQFSELLQAQSTTAEPFAELHDWLTNHLHDETLSVETLARHACMSARNFARVYKTKTGRTPAKTIELFRLESARRLLEDTNERIETIARRTGFGDEDRMRNTFQRHLNVSPRDYRERFGNQETAVPDPVAVASAVTASVLA
jgi:transcriptional regulator GlxA family with amidase domain